MEAKIHDLRSGGGSGDGVVLIVRKGNKYGPAHAGERVRVDACELQNRSTMEACMSEEDYEKYLADRAAKAKKAAEPKKTPISAAVDEGLERLAKAAQAKQLERAAREAEAPPAAPEARPTVNTASEGIPLADEPEAEVELGELPPAAPLPQPGGKSKPPLSSQPKQKK
jgi:hypothetical protein